MNQLRISFILSSLWLSGGVRVIVEIANRLSRRGHQISIVFPGGTFDADMASEVDPTVTLIEARETRDKNTGYLGMLRLSYALARHVPASDVVISTHTPTTPAGWIASALMNKGQRIWYYQDYREMFADRPIVDWLLRHALLWNKGAVVVSQYSRDELLGYVPGKEVVVVSNGLSHPEYFHPIPEDVRSAHHKGGQTILYLGDLRPRKGWFEFLSAAEIVYQRNPNIRLWIVSKENIQFECSLPHKYFYRPSRADLAELYGLCDVFVSASWWESFGLPPLEAMACGAPVVMTDSRGVRDFAKPGENCLLVPTHEIESLADAITRVLSDPDLSNRFRQNGPPTAALYDWETVTNHFEEALSRMVR
jgi:glycosyltransferase involved in cell wall biosynthesis